MGRAHHESSLLRLFSICRTISLFSACLQRLPTFILTRFVWPCDRRLAPSLKFISFFIGSIESLAFNYLVGFGNLARVNGDWSSSHHVILLEVSYHPKGPQSCLGSQLLTSILLSSRTACPTVDSWSLHHLEGCDTSFGLSNQLVEAEADELTFPPSFLGKLGDFFGVAHLQRSLYSLLIHRGA